MHKFKIGDRARIIGANQEYQHLIGLECEIVALPGANKHFASAYEIDFKGKPHAHTYAEEVYLEKILPKEQTSTWEEFTKQTQCGWLPEKQDA